LFFRNLFPFFSIRHTNLGTFGSFLHFPSFAILSAALLLCNWVKLCYVSHVYVLLLSSSLIHLDPKNTQTHTHTLRRVIFYISFFLMRKIVFFFFLCPYPFSSSSSSCCPHFMVGPSYYYQQQQQTIHCFSMNCKLYTVPCAATEV